MIPRFAVSLMTGVLVTFSLLWIMQILIATGKKAVIEEPDFNLGDFIMVKREETVNRDENEPEPPPEVEEAPPDVPPVMQDSLDTSQALNISSRGNRIGIDLSQGGAWIGEGDYLPIVKINPIYPRRAQTRGLEGQCLMEFTVTTTGATKDARVVECTSSLFERASVNAVLKWKYKPRVQNGQPVEVPGVQHIITFELED
ncbi:MAG: energy transducer TonB [Gammaproteobacteria bacterium]|jgi:protein TonB|nr:energy transducer TonB [Gammaproteobacteria bacterium]MDP6615946.1 energy transducer TonB [Gammaproteobacteria bacterium]MDP6695015.1 energy transducer TonB [Gammaproteobacteria bacterium]MDP7041619.1 energy transducer TonB [Gammaproteobacteria bacterium]